MSDQERKIAADKLFKAVDDATKLGQFDLATGLLLGAAMLASPKEEQVKRALARGLINLASTQQRITQDLLVPLAEHLELLPLMEEIVNAQSK